MRNFTDTQIEKIKALAENASVVKARKAITLYKSEDVSYARFRLTAAAHIQRVTICAALKRKVSALDIAYAEQWIFDANPMFREFYAELNAAAGYVVIKL